MEPSKPNPDAWNGVTMEHHGQVERRRLTLPDGQAVPSGRFETPAVIRAVIVDDEPLARRGIRARLERAGGYTVVAECASGREAIAAIREHAPSVVFLDVQMPGIDGFGVIDEIGADHMPVVIFVTAFDNHALKAFEAHAFDYLLKPIDDDRFATTIDRARRRVVEREESEVARRLAALMNDIRPTLEGTGAPRRADALDSAASGSTNRIVVRDRDRVLLIDVGDIDWIGADGDYVRIHANGKSHLVRDTMTAMEHRLDPAAFVRIHRSAIVNASRIRELKPYSSREYAVILRDGTRLRLSRRYRERLRAHFGEYL
jgi:two-component system, LytTR family, response regulator